MTEYTRKEINELIEMKNHEMDLLVELVDILHAFDKKEPTDSLLIFKDEDRGYCAGHILDFILKRYF